MGGAVQRNAVLFQRQQHPHMVEKAVVGGIGLARQIGLGLD